MPEEVTQVDPDDSLEMSDRSMKPKSKRWSGPIGCLQCDYTTKEQHEAGASFQEQQDTISQHLDTHGKWRYVTPDQEELARLEREVIEAAMRRHHAQSDYSDATYRGGGQSERAILRQADCDLRVATLALDEFQSQHK